jgi:hypothetical protein
MVFSHDALADFAEGLATRGLVNKIPGLGKIHQMYGEYLFQDYIPRLKMKMATDALERNTKRYGGKLSPDQILELTAKQANAAFGELNYQMMGRNKTVQDLFRIVALAPDFLEARAKFAAQGLKPYGREQAAALIRLSAIMAVTAQVTNYLVNSETDMSHPFSIKINGKYYTLRSVPGDIMHLITSPRTFSYNRLNPTIARPIIEALTGRDQFGRKRGILTQLADWGKAHVPIPLQAPLWKHDSTLADSVLNSMGIGAVTARTKAEQAAMQYHMDNIPGNRLTEEAKAKYVLKHQATEKLKENYANGINNLLDLKHKGQLSERDIKDIKSNAKTPTLVRYTKNLTIHQFIEVYDLANDDEKKMLNPTLSKKYLNFKRNHAKADVINLNQKLQNSFPVAPSLCAISSS